MAHKFNITGCVPEYLAVSTYQRMAEVYGITEAEYNLYVTAYTNLNTEIGYDAYYQLHKAVIARDGDRAILADLAASFAWDSRLSEAIEQRVAAEMPNLYWEPGAEDADNELPESEWVTEEPPFD